MANRLRSRCRLLLAVSAKKIITGPSAHTLKRCCSAEPAQCQAAHSSRVGDPDKQRTLQRRYLGWERHSDLQEHAGVCWLEVLQRLLPLRLHCQHAPRQPVLGTPIQQSCLCQRKWLCSMLSLIESVETSAGT